VKPAERYLAWIADVCREAYINERTAYEIRKDRKLASRRPPYKYSPGPRWDGGETDDGVEREPIWPKIASFMIEHELEPIACIRKRFLMARGSNPPWPTQIAVETYLDVYKGLKEVVAEEDVTIWFNIDKEYCRTAINSSRYGFGDKEKQWTAMLLDSALDVSPLMRYCLAHELKLPKVQAILQNRALLQYMQAPTLYDKIWGTHIPSELSDIGKNILASLNLKRKKTDGE
jgi:hypothetical protein